MVNPLAGAFILRTPGKRVSVKRYHFFEDCSWVATRTDDEHVPVDTHLVDLLRLDPCNLCYEQKFGPVWMAALADEGFGVDEVGRIQRAFVAAGYRIVKG